MNRCPTVADLAGILALPQDHPGHQHMAACPRCRTLARRLGDFLTPGRLPDEADEEAASLELQRRLQEVLPDLLQSDLTPPDATLADDALADDAPPASRPRSLATADRKPAIETIEPLRSPGRGRRRQWYALAAVVVVAIGLFSIRQQILEPGLPPGGQAPVLRGIERDLPIPRLIETATELRVVWSPHPESDGAVIVLFDADLRELASMAVADRGEHAFVWAAAGGALPAAARYLRVEFRQQGDVIGRTPLTPL